MATWSSARPAAAFTVNGEGAVFREADTAVVDDKGDALYSGTLVLPTQAVYLRIKEAYPNPYLFLRQLIGSGGKTALANVVVNYDDGKRSISFSATMLGAAVSKRHRWQVDVGHGSEMLHLDGRTAVLLSVKPLDGVTAVVSAKVQLPAGADHVRVDADAGVLSYDLERAAKVGTADLDVDMKVKPRLMSALYKVYADPAFADGAYWTSKTLFTNNGTGDITHLKVKYRLGDYTTDWSPTTEYATVAPGGHAVDLYYPLLKSEVAALKSQSPVDLEVKYSYTDSAGKQVEDTVSKRITILGGNQFEYANVAEEERTGTWLDANGNDPLEAAFVTKMDEPVRSLGGMAAQACHGQPAGHDDQAAQLFCKALYDLEVANGLAYQWSVGDDLGRGASAQSLKYPRDVIRDKSGTCIELAIMYAAVCESQGLECLLVNIPGHCFPVVKLPSGSVLPVETTCISAAAVGEQQKQPLSFEDAVKFGFKELGQLQQKPAVVVRIDDVQGHGVVCPELPAVPANVMQAWGWKLAEVTPDPTPGPNPGPVPVGDAHHPVAMCGTWDARFVGPDGGNYTVVEQVGKDGTYQMNVRGPNGATSDHGTWQIDDDRNLVGHSDVAGTTEVDQVQLDGDTLMIHNADRDFTLRMTRRR